MYQPPLTAFRLGDVRGVYPTEIDESFARDFGRAFARHFRIRGKVATGRDMRTSSASLQQALVAGLVDHGLTVVDLGLCATELGYYASTLPGIDATIIVTASHNPARYNGFKCVLRNGEAVTFDSGLSGVMHLMLSQPPRKLAGSGSASPMDLYPGYLALLEERFHFDPARLGRIALNGLNGTASTLAGRIAEAWSLPVTWFRRQPGPIPEEGADPARPRLAAEMKSFMQGNDFALGIAWDGDCDRCVFFDEAGNLLPTYYIVGLLAEYFLGQSPGSAIVFDTKLRWNTLDIIRRHGGRAVASRTGHAFMKRAMREHKAAYGGELSSHHFFGGFNYCDSGMFAWLTMLALLDARPETLAELVETRRRAFCCTPEINLRLDDATAALAEIERQYAARAADIDHFDGLAIELPEGWRFSLTPSKTEPLVRLNLESRAGEGRLLDEGAKLLRYLAPFIDDDQVPESSLYTQ